eukprot:7440255-Lingulodinium_polyedra.AAC.1
MLRPAGHLHRAGRGLGAAPCPAAPSSVVGEKAHRVAHRQPRSLVGPYHGSLLHRGLWHAPARLPPRLGVLSKFGLV